jgi:hypothetical protein
MDVHWTRLGAVVLPGKHKPFPPKSPPILKAGVCWGCIHQNKNLKHEAFGIVGMKLQNAVLHVVMLTSVPNG